ncbi:MAG: VTT domain-containing protein [Acidobacteriota bacterium]|nr:VTT domain-containing protein [Acidobacteriota bacterium]
MLSLREKLTARIQELRNDYGKIGFWAVYALVMPIFGLAALTAVIYKAGPWFKESPTGLVVFTLSVALLCGFAILTTNIISIVAGWAFGFFFGLAGMMTGIAGAVAINFYFARKLAGEKFDKVLDERPRINAIHKELLAGHIGKVFLIILLLRLSITPFAGTNYLISASGVSFGTYFWATIIGYVPRTAAAVFVGTTIELLNLDQPREVWMLGLSIAATILALILISILSKRALDRLTVFQDHAI